MSLDTRCLHLDEMAHPRRAMRLKDGEDVFKWQAEARAKLKELLGLPLAMPADDMFNIEYEKRDDPRFEEIRFTFACEPGVEASAYLLTPKGAKPGLPVVICLQGHSTGVHISLGRPKYEGDAQTISGGDRDFALQIVARGWAALALEQRGFGERGGSEKGPDCGLMAMQALMLGRTLIGERCWDISRAIDVIEKRFPSLDSTRVALMGQSGGGTATIYAAAIDERICAAMPASSFCGYRDSIGVLLHCLCNYVPRCMEYFDMGDLAGMCAPRPYIAVNGKDDPIFPLNSFREQAEEARRVYAAAGAADKFRALEGWEGHRFYASLAWPVFQELTGF